MEKQKISKDSGKSLCRCWLFAIPGSWFLLALNHHQGQLATCSGALIHQQQVLFCRCLLCRGVKAKLRKQVTGWNVVGPPRPVLIWDWVKSLSASRWDNYALEASTPCAEPLAREGTLPWVLWYNGNSREEKKKEQGEEEREKKKPCLSVYWHLWTLPLILRGLAVPRFLKHQEDRPYNSLSARFPLFTTTAFWFSCEPSFYSKTKAYFLSCFSRELSRAGSFPFGYSFPTVPEVTLGVAGTKVLKKGGRQQ